MVEEGSSIVDGGFEVDSCVICDLIYRNRSKSHIGSYEIIDFKDFNTL